AVIVAAPVARALVLVVTALGASLALCIFSADCIATRLLFFHLGSWSCRLNLNHGRLCRLGRGCSLLLRATTASARRRSATPLASAAAGSFALGVDRGKRGDVSIQPIDFPRDQRLDSIEVF